MRWDFTTAVHYFESRRRLWFVYGSYNAVAFCRKSSFLLFAASHNRVLREFGVFCFYVPREYGNVYFLLFSHFAEVFVFVLAHVRVLIPCL